MLGCPYYIEGSVKNDIINVPELFNSMVLVGDGYIDAVTSKTAISKSNLFDEYRYFDREVTLNSITYENDNFDVLIADDIMDSKNIMFIKERDTDFVVCVDTSVDDKRKQLAKIAKWTGKNVLYLNNLGYDTRSGLRFLGESFVFNSIGESIYENTSINEDLIKLETSIINGKIAIDFIGKPKADEDFVNIVARNYADKTVVYRVSQKPKTKFEKNVKLITFDRVLEGNDVEFIDMAKYIKIDGVDDELKKLALKNIYKDCIVVF